MNPRDIFQNVELLEKMNDFFLKVGEVDDYEEFVRITMEELRKLVSYDQGVALYVNAAGNPTSCYLLGVSEDWKVGYLEYYAKLQKQFPLGMRKDLSGQKKTAYIRPIVWADLPTNDFITDCIDIRGVRSSFDIPLYDPRSQSRLILALDRTRKECFTERDELVINHLIPHLNNLHRKFFLGSSSGIRIGSRKDALLEMSDLTRREKEIVAYLCEGVPPARIATLLKISYATTNKHIANIYKKLKISNLQELLVRFLH